MALTGSLILLFLSAAFFVISMPHIPFFTLVFLLPSLFVYRRLSPSRAFMAGLVQWSLAYGLVFYWVPGTLDRLFSTGPFLSFAIFVPVILFFYGLYHALFSLATAPVLKNGNRSPARILLLCSVPAAAWSGMELFRGLVFPALNIATLASAWYRHPFFLQGVGIVGEHLFSFIIILFNVSIYVILEYLVVKRREIPFLKAIKDPLAMTSIFLVSGITICIFSAGLPRDAGGGKELSPGSKILVIQANIPPQKKWKKEYYREITDRYLTLTEKNLSPGTRAVLWPETALNYYPQLMGPQMKRIIKFCQEKEISILAGGPEFLGHGETRRYYNALFLVTGSGVRTLYRKEKLFPLSEYNPFPVFDSIYKKYSETQFSSWKKNRSFSLAGIPAGFGICFESTFPCLMTNRSRGNDLLIIFTDDAWLGDSTGPELHQATLVLRAVENRRWVIHCNNSGPSALISPDGSIKQETDFGITGTIRINGEQNK
jgi:apolipoprotein N-acyltransferase